MGVVGFGSFRYGMVDMFGDTTLLWPCFFVVVFVCLYKVQYSAGSCGERVCGRHAGWLAGEQVGRRAARGLVKEVGGGEPNLSKYL